MKIKLMRKNLFKLAATKDGGICPCCDRFTKIYKRRFNKAMAESLLWLFKESGPKKVFVNIGNNAPRYVVRNGGSLASCRWWGLVKQEKNTDTKKHTSGSWRITNKGIKFIKGIITIPSHVHTYNTKCLEKSLTKTTMQESLGRPFDYRELMGALIDSKEG